MESPTEKHCRTQPLPSLHLVRRNRALPSGKFNLDTKNGSDHVLQYRDLPVSCSCNAAIKNDALIGARQSFELNLVDGSGSRQKVENATSVPIVSFAP